MKRTVVDVALRFYQNGIVWKRTAEEFFFKGFEDNIVNLLSIFPSSFRSAMGLFVPWDRIGFTYGVSKNSKVNWHIKVFFEKGRGDLTSTEMVPRPSKVFCTHFPLVGKKTFCFP